MKPEAALAIRALYADMTEIIEKRELAHAKILHKVNAQGALVVALIVPATLNDPDKWRDEPSPIEGRRQ